MRRGYGILKTWKYILAIPHLIVYSMCSDKIKKDVNEDLAEMNRRCKQEKGLAYYLVFQQPYRNLFYYRIKKWAPLLSVFLPRYGLFFISSSVESIGGGCFVLNHPFGSFINCKSIGNNFTICQLTTLGNKTHGRNDLVPTIGNSVTLGANVSIMGGIRIGNNVIVGAGSVVVKDVPNDCVVAGNPAKVIRYLTD